MSNDSDFMLKISQNDQNTDSDDYVASKLHCSAVVDISASECTSSISSIQSRKFIQSDSATQQAINVQILAQLSSISDRLNVLEQHKAKKDLDPKKEGRF